MALRSFRRSPGVALIVVLTLAIGVGANTSMYTLVWALMLQPPVGVSSPERLVKIDTPSNNYASYRELARNARSVSVAGYVRTQSLSFGLGDNARPVRTQCVTSTFFRVLGAQPMAGRLFRQNEAEEEREPAAVVSYAFWRGALGADRAAIGRRVLIGARPFTLIAIMPRGFSGATMEAVDAWLLLNAAPDVCSINGRSLLQQAAFGWLRVIGRVGDGVTLDQARAELTPKAPPVLAMLALPGGAPPRTEPLYGVRRAQGASDTDLALWLLGGSATLLLVACFNIAGLFTIRTIERRRDLAVRLQLGASRVRLVRHILIEHALLSLVALIVAMAMATGLNAVIANYFDYVAVGEMTPPFWLATGTMAFATVASALGPILLASRIDATTLSQSSGFAGRERGTVRAVLLVVQVALAFVLMIACGLFVRSVQNTRRGLGVEANGLLIVSGDLRRAAYGSTAEIQQMFEQLATSVRRHPGVQSAATRSGAFLDNGERRRVALKGGPPATMMNMTAVSSDYFATAGTRILRGRPFSALDIAGSQRVAIVDQHASTIGWPDTDPIGQCFFVPLGSSNCYLVIGIAESARDWAGATRDDPELFVPQAQTPSMVPHLLFVRAQDVSTARSAVSLALRAIGPNLGSVPSSGVNHARLS